MIHSCLLLESYIYPTSSSFFSGSIKSNSLSKLTQLISLKMMQALNRIHQPSVLQIRMQFKQMFSQILRSFQILQISCHVFCWIKILTFWYVWVILEDDYLVYFKNWGYSCNFADKICSELWGLWNFEYGVGYSNCQMFKLDQGCDFILFLLFILLIVYAGWLILFLLVTSLRNMTILIF